MKELTEQEAWYKVSSFCSLAEHCSSEAGDKLIKWGVEDSVRKRIIDKLLKENYINEERYCNFFIHDKLIYNKWGKVRLGQELRRKLIPATLIASCMDNIDEEEYLTILKELLRSKRKNLRGKNEYEINGKLIRFALGRGFEMNVIRQYLKVEDYERMDS